MHANEGERDGRSGNGHPGRRRPDRRWDAEHRHEPWWTDWVRLRDLLEAGRGDLARELSGELASKWPEVPVIQHYARVLEPPVVRVVSALKGRDHRKDDAWLQEHAHEYPGCWLAVYEGRLIAANPDLQVVLEAVRRQLGDETTLLHHEFARPAQP